MRIMFLAQMIREEPLSLSLGSPLSVLLLHLHCEMLLLVLPPALHLALYHRSDGLGALLSASSTVL